MSAKVLPAAYAANACALAYKATRVGVPAPERAVLLAASALSALDLGPTANTQLTSAKRAVRAAGGDDEAKRRAARTWRNAVRLKVVGQVLGLTSMAVGETFTGAARTLAANIGFWSLGAGANRHDVSGVLTPVPSGLVRIIFAIDAAICVGAYAASVSAVGSTRRAVGAGVVVAGMLFGVMEKLPKLFLPKPPAAAEAA